MAVVALQALDVENRAQLFEEFPHLQLGHLRSLKDFVSRNQQQCPQKIVNWAAKQVEINKQNKASASGFDISVKDYLMKCGVEMSAATFEDSVERNSLLGPVPFRFVRGDVAKFHEDLFGRSDKAPLFAGILQSAKFEATHIFLDLPPEFNPDFTEETLEKSLSAALIRTSAPTGIVVVSCTFLQVGKVVPKLLEVFPSFNPKVITVYVRTPKSNPKDQFSQSSFAAVVSFWGQWSNMDTIGTGGDRSATERYDTFPIDTQVDVQLDSGFSQFGFSDMIIVPPAIRWKKREEKIVSGQIPQNIPTKFLVCDQAKPVEFYHYFLQAFQFATTERRNAMVFDLCCGSGTASVVATVMGMGAIGIDKDLEMCQQAHIRMMETKAAEVSCLISLNTPVFDLCQQPFRRFTKPDPDSAPKTIEGEFLYKQPYVDRIAGVKVQEEGVFDL